MENENLEIPKNENMESLSNHTSEEEHDLEPHDEPQEVLPKEVRRSTRKRR